MTCEDANVYLSIMLGGSVGYLAVTIFYFRRAIRKAEKTQREFEELLR